jgi:hypothetical protein
MSSMVALLNPCRKNPLGGDRDLLRQRSSSFLALLDAQISPEFYL